MRHSITPVLLVTIWAGLLITFLVVRPSPHSFPFWWLIGAAGFFGGLYMLLSHQEGRRTERATLAWLRQVHELVDVHDYVDDGHLPEYLDDTERRIVIEELERMPVGSRSLRQPIKIVSPELVDDDG